MKNSPTAHATYSGQINGNEDISRQFFSVDYDLIKVNVPSCSNDTPPITGKMQLSQSTKNVFYEALRANKIKPTN